MRSQSRRLVLPTALALAASTLLPMTAHAETSSGNVYVPEVPNVKTAKPERTVDSTPTTNNRSGTHNTPGDHPDPTATTGERTDVEKTTGHEEEQDPKSDRRHGAAPATGDGDHHGDGGQTGGGDAKSPQGSEPERKGPESSSEIATGGGSSPVLPILIALVVLATISIGVVIYRERRPVG